MFFSKKVTVSELVRSIFVPVVLGLASGIVGALLVESYLTALSIPAAEPLRIGRLPSASNGSLSQPDLAERLRRVNLPLYPRRAAAFELAQRARGLSDATGYATVLTSDGWLATAPSAVAAPVSVAVGGRLFEPKARVVDPRTGIVFLKIDASALPVSGFEETAALRNGAPLYALDAGGSFHAAAFAGTTPSHRRAQAPHLQNADLFTRAFHLDRPVGALSGGGAVLSANGDLSGILVPDKSGADVFVPIHLIRPVLAQVFRGETPNRAALGVHYLSLNDLAFDEGGFGAVKGLRLTGSRALGIPAVRPGSAAAKAGFQEGDVIVRADGVDLASGRDLGELLGEWAPGSTIRFDVLKDGAERAVEVTLDGEKR